MKGYCVDVRGFSEQKKEMVVKAIGTLIDYRGGLSLWDGQERLGNVSRCGVIFCGVAWGTGKPSKEQIPNLISFNELMMEAGFNYVEDGVEGFKEKVMNGGKLEFIDLLEKQKLIELMENDGVKISELQSEIESLHGQLRSGSEEIGNLKVKLQEAEKELLKSRVSGAVCLVCLAVVAVSNLFFGG